MTSAPNTNMKHRDLRVSVDKASADGDWSAETTYVRNEEGAYQIVGVAYRDKRGKWVGFDGLTPSQMKAIDCKEEA